MFSATCEILMRIIDDGVTYAQRGDADGAYEELTSFEFVLILHIMKKIFEISDLLCQALQCNIFNAMQLVSSTKLLIQNLQNEEWDMLLSDVKSFCERVSIPLPNMSDRYSIARVENKFNEKIMEFLVLSSALDPREMLISMRIDDIDKLVRKFYPHDFTEHEMTRVKMQFEHFSHECQHQMFGSLSTISELCQWLVKTRKADIYPLVYRLVTFVLILPVSTATTKRSFSAMSLVKKCLRNKMEDKYLSDQ